jgi:hypothetical protein
MINILKQKNNSKVWWRATLVDSACPDMQITFEFLAPKYNKALNYTDLAVHALLTKINDKHIKLKFVEPVEN